MRRMLGLAACAILALEACQAATLPIAPSDRKRASTAPSTTPSATPKAGGSAGAGTSAAASPAPTILNALLRPAGATTALAGTVALDAGYLVAAGGGSLVAAGGGNIVAAGGLNMVAAGAGNLVAAGGGNVIVNNGGNVIVNNGGNVIPTGGGHVIPTGGGHVLVNNGGNIVAAGAGNVVAAGAGNMVAAGAGNLTAPFDAAGNLVAAGAGNILSPNGGQIVAAGGLNYRLPRFGLLQASAPTPGEQRPAAGVLVSVVSLATGRYLALGADAQGQPVYAVYTDLRGGYEVWLPAEATGNVAVVVSAAAADARLNYNLVTPPAAGAPAAVDESTALAARYLRRALTGRMRFMLQQPDLVKYFLATDKFMRPAASAKVGAMIDRLAAIGAEAGVDFQALPDAAIDRVAQRMLDASLAGFDLAATPINARDLAGWDADLTVNEGAARPDLPLLQALRACTWFVLEGAAARLRRDPAAFARAYLETRVNDVGDGAKTQPLSRSWEGEIRKPADVGEFLLAEYLGTIRENIKDPLRRLGADLFTALDAEPAELRAKAPAGVLKLDPALPAADRAAEAVQVMIAAGNQLSVEVARRVDDDAALRATLLAIVKAETQPSSAPTPVP